MAHEITRTAYWRDAKVATPRSLRDVRWRRARRALLCSLQTAIEIKQPPGAHDNMCSINCQIDYVYLTRIDTIHMRTQKATCGEKW